MHKRLAAELEIDPVEPHQLLDRGIEFNLVTAGFETLDCFASTETSRGNTTVMLPERLEFAERLRAPRTAGIIGAEVCHRQGGEGSGAKNEQKGVGHKVQKICGASCR